MKRRIKRGKRSRREGSRRGRKKGSEKITSVAVPLINRNPRNSGNPENRAFSMIGMEMLRIPIVAVFTTASFEPLTT